MSTIYGREFSKVTIETNPAASILDNTATKVPFDLAVTDKASSFSDANNWLVCPRTGWYEVKALTTVVGDVGDTTLNLTLTLKRRDTSNVVTTLYANTLTTPGTGSIPIAVDCYLYKADKVYIEITADGNSNHKHVYATEPYTFLQWRFIKA